MTSHMESLKKKQLLYIINIINLFILIINLLNGDRIKIIVIKYI